MNILLIQIMRLGDALQVIPVIRGLKHFFPQSKIHVLTSTIGAQVFEWESEIEEVFTLNKQKLVDLVSGSEKKNILSAVDMLQSDLEPVMKIRWDWVINFSFSYPSALLSFSLDAKHLSGFAVNNDRQYFSKEKWFCHSLASFVHRRYSNFNWVDINRRMIGLPSVPSHPLLEPRSEDVLNAMSHIREIGFEGKKIVAMHPWASGDHKMWPLEKFGSLGQTLVNEHDSRIIILGGKSERELGAKLKNYVGDKAENLAGKTTLGELMAFLSLCDILVSNDSGPMHFASVVGTQVIALFFNSHFVETGPYGPGHVAVHPNISCFPCQGPAKCSHKECLDHISSETIEAIVLNRKHLKTGIAMDLFSSNDGTARVFSSAFDPWGMLEWVPIDGGPTTFGDIERILLRISWMYHSGIIDDVGTSERDYLAGVLQAYGNLSDRTDLENEIKAFAGQLARFKQLLEVGYKISSDIQSELLRGNSDTSAIKSLGDRLSKAEDDISSFEKNTSISFLSELLAVSCENVEKKDMLDLSTRTIGCYRDIMAITDLMINRANDMGVLWSSLNPVVA